jgi:hypothetical protein
VEDPVKVCSAYPSDTDTVPPVEEDDPDVDPVQFPVILERDLFLLKLVIVIFFSLY